MAGKPKGLVTEEGRGCSKCGEFKTWDCFDKNARSPYGRSSSCKDCRSVAGGYKKRNDCDIGNDGRECANCREWKAWNEFAFQAKGPGGHYSCCKKCDKKTRIKSHYGIEPEEYERMLEAQGGKCTICGGIGGVRGLCVDHNHETGQIRNLLCDNCNRGIGYLQESIEVLKSSIKYIEGWNS